MKDYVTLSLELHLFFDRIMKEHSLFLEAGFQRKDIDYINRADWLFKQFQELLEEVVDISNNRVRNEILQSGEIVTDFTLPAEKKTSQLTGASINFEITCKEHKLTSYNGCGMTREITGNIKNLNQKALILVRKLIEFKEEILEEVCVCKLYTANYPLLIQHILREAKLYQSLLSELEMRGTISPKCIRETELFWNQIMMEHALFIRGLLDPTEEELIMAADGFARDYKELLTQARIKNCRTMDELTRRTLKETEKYRDFKAAGTKGITDCEITSIILPLLADHVLREANHYLRILENTCDEAGGTYGAM